jgi:hypothetical protein
VPVSVGSAFSWAFSSWSKSFGPWLLAGLIVIILGALVSWLTAPDLRDVVNNLGDPEQLETLAATGVTFGETLLGALGALLTFVIGSIAAHGALAATRRGAARLGDFFALRNVGNIVLLGIVVGVIDLVLSFIPFLGPLLSLVVSFFLAAALFFVIDKGQGAVPAMRSSAQLVSRNAGTVLLTLLLVIVTVVLGFLACFVGALVAVPVAYLLGAYVYRRLLGERVAV